MGSHSERLALRLARPAATGNRTTDLKFLEGSSHAIRNAGERRQDARWTLKPTLKRTLKRTLKKPFAALLYRLPEGVQRALFTPRVRAVANKVPILRNVYSGCLRKHPIDLHYGTDTSGLVDADRLQDDSTLVSLINPYMGSQPSIIRRALQTLPDIGGYTFIDFGCGKGRPMIIATEFAFSAVLGLDISAELVQVANKNAALIARKFPERTPMKAMEANVSEVSLPAGKLVIFLYNPFADALISALLNKIEAALADETEHLFVVYVNPVAGHLFDASPGLTRWFARAFSYQQDERGYGPEEQESAVIWQSVRGALQSSFADRHRPIRVKNSLRAVVE
jgi:SAM-dependent methyltransferase